MRLLEKNLVGTFHFRQCCVLVIRTSGLINNYLKLKVTFFLLFTSEQMFRFDNLMASIHISWQQNLPSEFMFNHHSYKK